MRRFKSVSILEEFKYTPFISLTPIALFLASSIPVNYIFHDASVSQDVRYDWLLASTVTSVVGFFVVVIMKYICVRFAGNQIRISSFTLLAALFGGLKGATSVLIVNYLQDDGQLDLAQFFLRIYSGGSVAAAIGYTIALVTVYRSKIRANKLQIEEENQLIANDLVGIRNEIMMARTESEEQLVNQIISNLNVRSDLDLYAQDPEKNWVKISEALQKGISQRVRQQSHELAQISKIEPSFRSKVKSALRLRVLHLHPKVYALVQLSMGASIYYSETNLRNSILLLSLNTMAILIITSAVRDIFLTSKERSENSNIIIFFSLVTTINSIFLINQELVWGYVNPILIIPAFIWHLFLVYFISAVSEIIQRVEADRELALSVNEDLRDKKRVLDQYLKRLNNEIGKHLHGYLLAKINSTATNLDQLAKQGRFNEYRVELEKLLSEFSLEKFRQGLQSDQVDDGFFQALQQLWDGLIEIEFSGDLEFYNEFQQVQTVELAHVIEEIISNAYRHGKATHIKIQFDRLENGDLRLTGVDDGDGVSEKFQRSLGSNIYELASGGRWSIKNRSEGGAVVELTITPYLWESAIRFSSGVPATFDPPVDQSH